MRREARLLRSKAVASLRHAATSFNSFENQGRVTTTVLHFQHAFEMLLKAALANRRVRLFDPRSGKSIGFEKCVNLGREHLGLSEEAAGTLRALGALRDDEQHYLGSEDEGLLYVHARAAVTLFDDILQSEFTEALADYLPARVLPISTEAPGDFDLLIDRQFTQVADLLAPGRRRRPEARGKIRMLLAMEAHVAEDVFVSERDVSRVERAIKEGKTRPQVFPRLENLTTHTEGTGLTVTVRFAKKEGVPVRFVAADDPAEAAAVREVDLQRKYHFSKQALAEALNLTGPKATALRRFLGIDDDPSCVHEFVFGKSRHAAYSDNAFQRMRDALAGDLTMDEVWERNRPRRAT
jgi:hypothetical protein